MKLKRRGWRVEEDEEEEDEEGEEDEVVACSPARRVSSLYQAT